MNEYKIIAQRMGLLGISNLLIGISGIIFIPILTKNIPLDDYGIWVQVSITVYLLPILITLGLPYAMVRYLSSENKLEKIQEGFYSILIVILISATVFSLFLLIISDYLSVILFNSNLAVVNLLILIVFIRCLINHYINYFRTFQQIKKYCFFSTLNIYLYMALVIYFVFQGYGINGAVTGLLISSIIILITLIVLVYKEIGFIIPKLQYMKEYINFGIHIVPSNLSNWAINSSDRYIIGILLGSMYVGYYSPGYTIGSIISIYVAPFALMLPSVLSKMYDENRITESKIVLKYSLKYYLLVSIPSVFGLSLFSKQLLLIISTNDIASQSYLITPFVALSTLFYGAYAIIAQIVVMKKKTKIDGLIWVIAAISNIILNMLFVPYFGIIGAAITTLISFLLAFIPIAIYSYRLFEFDIDYGILIKSVIASIVMSIILININIGGIYHIIYSMMIGAVSYLIAILALGGINRNELVFLKQLYK